MKIQSLRIRNFRSLRSVELSDLENLNIIVGRNSTGKSNLLEALDVFFSEFSLVGGTTAGLDEYCWFNKKTKNPIAFEVDIELSDQEIIDIFPQQLLVDVGRFPPIHRTLIIRRRITNIQGAWETTALRCLGLALIADNLHVSGAEVFTPLVTEYAKAKKAKSVRLPSVAVDQLKIVKQRIVETVRGGFRLITQIRDVKNPIPHRITLIDPKLEQALWTLDQSVKVDDEEKSAEFQTGFIETTSLRLDPAQGHMYVRRRGRRFPLSLEGGGIQSSAQLIFELIDGRDKYRFIGIEEPEAHSHSDLQRRLFNELRSLSERCQLFMTTHSPTFVDRTNLKGVWISKFDDGETTFERASKLKEIVEEMGIRPSDILFFADKILFVEGKSEEIVIPVFSKKLGISLNDIAVISVEGKSKARLSLKTWLKTTRGMLPLFLLLDKDAEAEIKELEKDKLIEPGKYHVWRQGSIESYYPQKLLKKALKELDQRYSLGMDVNAISKRIKNGELSPDKIDLGEKQKLLDKSWEVLLAESVGRLLRESKGEMISEEVERALRRAVAA